MDTPTHLMSQTATELLAIEQSARAKWESEYADRPRLVALAKHLCAEDFHDPDVVVMGHSKQPPMLGAKGAIVLCQYPIWPSWCLYLSEAFAALEFLEKATD